MRTFEVFSYKFRLDYSKVKKNHEIEVFVLKLWTLHEFLFECDFDHCVMRFEISELIVFYVCKTLLCLITLFYHHRTCYLKTIVQILNERTMAFHNTHTKKPGTNIYFWVHIGKRGTIYTALFLFN